MLSTSHLDDGYSARNSAKTSANGLKFMTNIAGGDESWRNNVLLLCQIAILETIAVGKDVPDPNEVMFGCEIRELLPIALRPLVSICEYDEILLAIFREAYTLILHAYPHLQQLELEKAGLLS